MNGYEKTSRNWLHSVRSDARLNVRISFSFKTEPTADELLNVIQKAVGVSLRLGQEPEKGKAVFGAASALNVPAWKVMQQIAATQMTDGRWEKAGDGYVLRGRAKLVVDPETEKRDTAEKEKFKQVAAERDKALQKFPLRRDRRLSARLTITADNPKLSELLGRLADTTGLTFALANNLADHDPQFGNLALLDVPASVVMEMIAEKDMDGGRWEKTETGYRLEGTSTRLASSASSILIWPLLALAVTLIGAGLYVIVRNRSCPKPAAMSGNPTGETLREIS